MTPRPRLKRDWIGRYVRLLYGTQTRGGSIFKEGEVMHVKDNHGGLTLDAVRVCPHCKREYRHTICRVPMADVILLPLDYEPDEQPGVEIRQGEQVGWISPQDALPPPGTLVLLKVHYPTGKEVTCLGIRLEGEDETWKRSGDNPVVTIRQDCVERWTPIPDLPQEKEKA